MGWYCAAGVWGALRVWGRELARGKGRGAGVTVGGASSRQQQCQQRQQREDQLCGGGAMQRRVWRGVGVGVYTPHVGVGYVEGVGLRQLGVRAEVQGSGVVGVSCRHCCCGQTVCVAVCVCVYACMCACASACVRLGWAGAARQMNPVDWETFRWCGVLPDTARHSVWLYVAYCRATGLSSCHGNDCLSCGLKSALSVLLAVGSLPKLALGV